jgi:hypothetical protein
MDLHNHDRNAAGFRYPKFIRESQSSDTGFCIVELHEALFEKRGPVFRKCWRSIFGSASKCQQVDGCVDDRLIAAKFTQFCSMLMIPYY